MDKKWYVEIEGVAEDLDVISETIINASFEILNISGKYLIKSNTFEELENVEDVLYEAEKIIAIINGIANINLNLKDFIRIKGALRLIKGSENRYTYKNCKQIAYKGKMTNVTDINDPKSTNNCLEKWLILAEENCSVRKTFRLLNYGLNSYENPYRIYELIKEDLDKEHIGFLGITDDKISRFTGTINLPKYAGDMARHGHMDTRGMSEQPMTLEEISDFISRVIYDWIHFKVNSFYSDYQEDKTNKLIDTTWIVKITGNFEDLEKLSKVHTQNFSCFMLDGTYFIKHKRFNNFQYVEDVLDCAKEIVSVINGIKRINLNLKDNIKIISGSRNLQKLQSRVYYTEGSLNGVLVVGTSLNNKDRYENSIDKWIQLAEINESVNKVFRLLNYGFSCINMWRIVELIKKDLGKKYISILGTTREQIGRLKKSIDNPEIVGDLARHSVYKRETIKNPMNIYEASSYIYYLIYKWIHFRVNNEGLII